MLQADKPLDIDVWMLVCGSLRWPVKDIEGWLVQSHQLGRETCKRLATIFIPEFAYAVQYKPQCVGVYERTWWANRRWVVVVVCS